MFTEEEIIEAFSILDINKDNILTEEDLAFFNEFFEEKLDANEISEMIRMGDIDGSGEVKLEEFFKIASGQSLAPIG